MSEHRIPQQFFRAESERARTILGHGIASLSQSTPPHPEMAAMRRTASALAACLASAVASAGPVVPSPYVTLSPTVVMPSLNLGTCCGSSPDVGLAPWLAAGGVGIDTAYGYRDQDNISRGLATLKVSRPDVFILSKIDPNTTMVRLLHPIPTPAAYSCTTYYMYC